MIELDKFFSVPIFDNILKANGETALSSSSKSVATEIPAKESNSSEGENETGLISDLALILVVAGLATVIFKRLKQPVSWWHAFNVVNNDYPKSTY